MVALGYPRDASCLDQKVRHALAQAQFGPVKGREVVELGLIQREPIQPFHHGVGVGRQREARHGPVRAIDAPIISEGPRRRRIHASCPRAP